MIKHPSGWVLGLMLAAAAHGFVLKPSAVLAPGRGAVLHAAPPEDCTSSKKGKMFGFSASRDIARMSGLTTKEEWVEYSCPGSYTPPKRPDLEFPGEWVSWDDWLGRPYPFAEAREIARELNLKTKEEWEGLGKSRDPRLPVLPDRFYKTEFTTWEDWLGL